MGSSDERGAVLAARVEAAWQKLQEAAATGGDVAPLVRELRLLVSQQLAEEGESDLTRSLDRLANASKPDAAGRGARPRSRR